MGWAGGLLAAGGFRGLARWRAGRTVGGKLRHFLLRGLLIVILAVAVRDRLPRRRASSFAVVLLAMLGVALIFGRVLG